MSKPLFAPGEQGTLLALPNIQAMMSGVSTIFYQHPRYCLTYVDGTIEEARVDSMSAEDRQEPFRMVSKVQEAARRGKSSAFDYNMRRLGESFDAVAAIKRRAQS